MQPQGNDHPPIDNGIDNSNITCTEIQVMELYNLLKESGSDSVLIIDARPPDDYLASRVANAPSVNIPPSLLVRGATVNSIDRRLSKAVFELWITRSQKDHIFLIDHKSTASSLCKDSPLLILNEILVKANYQNKLKSKPRVISGGFDQWHIMLPSLCTDPMYSRKQQPSLSQSVLPSLSSLSYPSLVIPKKSPTSSKAADISAEEKTPKTMNEDRSHSFDSLGKHRANQSGIMQTEQKQSPKTSFAQDGVPPLSSHHANLKPAQGNFIIKDVEEKTSGEGKGTNIASGHVNGNRVAEVPKAIEQKVKPPISPSPLPSENGMSAINSINHKPYSNNVKPLQTRDVLPIQGFKSSTLENVPSVPQTTQSNAKPISGIDNSAPKSLISKQQMNQPKAVAPLKPDLPESLNIDQSPGVIINGSETIEPQKVQQPPGDKSALRQHLPTPKPNDPTLKPPQTNPTMPDQTSQLPKATVINGAHPIPTTPAKTVTPPAALNTTAITPAHVIPPGPVSQAAAVPKTEPGEIITINPKTGLPFGWEMSRDQTGKIFYKNHNDQSTSWDLPKHLKALVKNYHATVNPLKPGTKTLESNLKGQSSNANMNANQDQAPTSKMLRSSTVTADTPRSSLTRSRSTPNLAEAMSPSDSHPVVDRSIKPQEPKRMTVDRSRKPISETRMQNLMPVHGSKGQFLTGLKNLGNTCYMNSIVQCLSVTIPLSNYFVSGNFEAHINAKRKSAGFVPRELAFLMKVLWSGKYRSVSPYDFRHMIGYLRSDFGTSQQQDAHELLIILLDQLHKDLGKNLPVPANENNEDLPDEIAATKAWNVDVLNKNQCLVDMFQGQFCSTVCCLTCSHRSVTFESFSFLQLELPSKSSCSLEDCIRSFTKTEKISGKDSWKCSKCKQYREATKTFQIWRLPPILIIQLKRFSSDGIWHNKLQTNVQFPFNNLQIPCSRKQNNIERPSLYNLYAVVNHYGSFECGHYTAYCSVSSSNHWYCFDDNVVRELDKSSVRTSAAYVLFYSSIPLKPL